MIEGSSCARVASPLSGMDIVTSLVACCVCPRAALNTLLEGRPVVLVGASGLVADDMAPVSTIAVVRSCSSSLSFSSTRVSGEY